MAQWCCSTKWPRNFNGLQQQCISHSCYKSKVGLLGFFFTPRWKLAKQVSIRNIASYYNLREKIKFVNHVQFCKASAWKRSVLLQLTFHWLKHTIWLLLVQRAGISNTPAGKAKQEGWFREQWYNLPHHAFIFMGEKPTGGGTIYFREPCANSFKALSFHWAHGQSVFRNSKSWSKKAETKSKTKTRCGRYFRGKHWTSSTYIVNFFSMQMLKWGQSSEISNEVTSKQVKW